MKEQKDEIRVKIKRTLLHDRVLQIALILVKYEARKRELTLNPHEGDAEFVRYSSRLNVPIEELKEFFLQIVLTAALKTHFGEPITVKFENREFKLNGIRYGEIALKYLEYKGINTAPREFQDRLERLERETKIPLAELKEFYLCHVVAPSLEALEKSS